MSAFEKAAQSIAQFEENSIYAGFAPGNIQGIGKSSPYDAVVLSGDPEQVLETVSLGVTTFLKSSVEGPYTMIVGSDLWRYLSSYQKGYPLDQHLQKLLGSPVVLNPFIDETFLISTRGGDLKLIVGQDLSIGYHSHNSKNVRLFLTESFTFQVLDPSVILRIEWKK